MTPGWDPKDDNAAERTVQLDISSVRVIFTHHAERAHLSVHARRRVVGVSASKRNRGGMHVNMWLKVQSKLC